MAKREIDSQTILSNQNGFTLFEVMIAIAIFTIFATAFVTGEGYNLLDSSKLKEELIMKDLCENKINDIIVNPPELRDALTLTKETKDIEGYPEYQTIVEFKKFFVPDMNKISGNTGEDGKEKEESPQAQMEKAPRHRRAHLHPFPSGADRLRSGSQRKNRRQS